MTMDDRHRRGAAVVRRFARARARLSFVACIVALLGVVALAVTPLVAGRGLIQDLFLILTMLALAQYWNMLAGFAGLVSIGQQAFVGLGAYAMFALVIYANVDPLLAIALAGLATGLIAVPVTYLVFRLHGAYFAVGTWVVSEVFRLVLAQVKSLGGGTGTALSKSVTNDAAFVTLVADTLHLRATIARDVAAYWLALILAVGTIALVYGVLRSRQGLALAAIRDNEAAACSLGVDAFRTKFWVFVVAAFGSGLVGALIYLQKARISPDAAFSLLDWTANVIFIVVIGGIGTIEGPIVGVMVFYFMQSRLADFGAWYLMLLGALAITVMLFFPRGLWGTLAARLDIELFPLRRKLATTGDEKVLKDPNPG
jgi:branched-chain amino acid transport system permease protein